MSDTESSLSLVRTVGELVAGTGKELVLLHVMHPDRFASRQLSVNSVPALQREGGYFIDHALESEKRKAREIGKMAFEGMNVPFVSVGEVGNAVSAVLTTAERYRCDQIFITSHPSRWRRNQPFDKTVRQIAAAFDGMVTVVKDSGIVLDIDATIEEYHQATLLSDADEQTITLGPDTSTGR